MPICVNTAEVCDARDDDSSNAVGIKKSVRQFVEISDIVNNC